MGLPFREASTVLPLLTTLKLFVGVGTSLTHFTELRWPFSNFHSTRFVLERVGPHGQVVTVRFRGLAANRLVFEIERDVEDFCPCALAVKLPVSTDAPKEPTSSVFSCHVPPTIAAATASFGFMTTSVAEGAGFETPPVLLKHTEC